MNHALTEKLTRVEASEARLGGVRLDYMREMAALGSAVFERMEAFGALAHQQGMLKPEQAAIIRFATLGAIQADDCGECVQIHVNLDRAAGTDPTLLRLALARQPEKLPPAYGLAWRFGQAVARNADDMEELRQELEAIIGRAAMFELGFALACMRVYPTLKRATGYALSCSKVEIAA